jgi:hypothetical protein
MRKAKHIRLTFWPWRSSSASELQAVSGNYCSAPGWLGRELVLQFVQGHLVITINYHKLLCPCYVSLDVHVYYIRRVLKHTVQQ